MADMKREILNYLLEELERAIHRLQEAAERGIFDPLLGYSALELAEDSARIARLLDEC